MAENNEGEVDPVVNYRRPKKPYKVAFTGVYNVGKTSLFRRMFNEDFCSQKPPSSKEKDTREEIFHEDETVIPLEIWDTLDMDKHGSITQSYYRGSHFVLLVYSAIDEVSLHKLNTIAADVRRHEPMAKLILVRNKIDLPIGDEGVPVEKEKAFLRNMRRKIIANYSTSAKTPEGVDLLLRELCKQSLKMFKNRRRSEDYKDDGFRLDLDTNKEESSGKCCS